MRIMMASAAMALAMAAPGMSAAQDPGGQAAGQEDASQIVPVPGPLGFTCQEALDRSGDARAGLVYFVAGYRAAIMVGGSEEDLAGFPADDGPGGADGEGLPDSATFETSGEADAPDQADGGVALNRFDEIDVEAILSRCEEDSSVIIVEAISELQAADTGAEPQTGGDASDDAGADADSADDGAEPNGADAEPDANMDSETDTDNAEGAEQSAP